MRRPLVVTIEHGSTRPDVRARLAQSLDRIRAEAAPYVATIEHEWQGDTVLFRVTALAQAITGEIAVEDEVVRVTVRLPILLSVLGDKIAPRIRASGLKLLAPK